MQNGGAQTVWGEREQKISARETDHGPEVVSTSHYQPSHHQVPYSPSPASAYYAHQPPFPQSEVTEKKEPKKICGLKRRTFYLALVLAIFVVAASVGGGVGGSWAVYQTRNKSQEDAQATAAVTVTVTNPEATSSPTQTSSPTGTDIRIATPTLGLLPLDCPNLTGKTLSVTDGGKTYHYDLECGVDNNGSGIDIMAVVSYSLRDCLLACSSYTSREGAKQGIDPCAGVQYNVDMQDLVGSFSGNCFLKRRKGVVVLDTNTTNIPLHLSAYSRT